MSNDMLCNDMQTYNKQFGFRFVRSKPTSVCVLGFVHLDMPKYIHYTLHQCVDAFSALIQIASARTPVSLSTLSFDTTSAFGVLLSPLHTATDDCCRWVLLSPSWSPPRPATECSQNCPRVISRNDHILSGVHPKRATMEARKSKQTRPKLKILNTP